MEKTHPFQCGGSRAFKVPVPLRDDFPVGKQFYMVPTEKGYLLVPVEPETEAKIKEMVLGE
jgi:hypothetical protein